MKKEEGYLVYLTKEEIDATFIAICTASSVRKNLSTQLEQVSEKLKKAVNQQTEKRLKGDGVTNILIPINPEHVDNILIGLKRFEYRTKVAKKKIEKMVIYSTAPVKKVVAEVEVLGIISGTPEEVWEETKDYGCISKEFFDAYFSGRKVAFAYRLGKVKKFERSVDISEYGLKAAPQSFIYLDSDYMKF